MSIYAIIPTRDTENLTHTTKDLLEFFEKCSIQAVLVKGGDSIFETYETEFNKLELKDTDVCIFCHDDIHILDTPSAFVWNLKTAFMGEDVGFVGAAGTKYLGETAIWWDMELWKMGMHSGRVKHIDPEGKTYITDYGPPMNVAVLDGLFLAATANTIRDVGLSKPDWLTGAWDFYDIYYTSKALMQGKVNKVMKVDILHRSRGELVGRMSWHENRQAFINNVKLPLISEDKVVEEV
jgi:hypothetical protein